MPRHDIERLLAVTQSMLSHLEEAMLALSAGESGADAVHARAYEKLFGVKNSYVDVLKEIAGLVLKLETARDAAVAPGAGQEQGEISRLSAHDLVVIRGFLERHEAASRENPSG